MRTMQELIKEVCKSTGVDANKAGVWITRQGMGLRFENDGNDKHTDLARLISTLSVEECAMAWSGHLTQCCLPDFNFEAFLKECE